MAPREIELVGRDLAIGRSSDVDLTLPDPTQQVSSRHCQVQFRGDGYILVDSSTNGTLLNGGRIATPQRLKAGDVIGVGRYMIDVTERAPVSKAVEARMDLNSWDRTTAKTPAPTPAKPTIAPRAEPASELEKSLAQAVAHLVATRSRQRNELGVRSPDPLAGNPLTAPFDGAAQSLNGSSLSEAAVTAAVDEIERHHAATLRAMQSAFRETLDRIAPAAIERSVTATPGTGDAHAAALWRAYAAAFEGVGTSEHGFVDMFARGFREAYEELTRNKSSSATRRPS